MMYIGILHTPSETRRTGLLEAHNVAYRAVSALSKGKHDQISVLEITRYRRQGDEYLLLTRSGMVVGRTKDENVIRRLRK